jgi:glycosyltransferase involved in cell wall biosynthesis
MDLARRLTELAPEIVVGDELCFRELAPAFRSLARGAVAPKRVLLVHHLTAWETELPPRRQLEARAGEQHAIEASDWLIATSETTRARLLAEGVRERIDVVLPGADRLARVSSPQPGARSLEPGACPVRFVFLGAVVPRKRVVALTRAFAAGGASDHARLVIVGSTTRDEAYVGELRRAIAEHGLAERVELTGEVDEADVARALEEGDVLVMPSSLEGYGIAATEAIRAGLPVIAARAQGLEEALAPCPEARFFADDDAALGAALARFAGDAALRGSMIEAARAAADRMPTWAQCVESFRASLPRSPEGEGERGDRGAKERGST